MKGIILSAGRGTRLKPLSFTQPKTLLSIANKPVIKYCIESLLNVGITEIGIVINPDYKQAFEEHLREENHLGISITLLYQYEQKGISDAVKQAKAFIGKEPFLLLLGDNLIQESLIQLKESVQSKQANASIMLAKVKTPQDYGIAEVKGNQIIRIVEKPQQPQSDLAVIGAYAFDSSIFQAIESILPSKRGEYEITDAIQWLIDQNYHVTYTYTAKKYSDVGTIDRLLEANRWVLEEIAKKRTMISPHAQLKKCTIIEPVVIGGECKITNATIGPYVSIQSGAQITNCRIKESIILDNVTLEFIQGTIINSVFGKNTKIINNPGRKDKSISFIVGEHSFICNDGAE
ncbi:glucose-1-phosphate thymidylyltransferase [Halalkalibacterium ligniniphilum]|uniref:glucose-1-phosphate thymidylyltransferase n=1 Tax=Halalkalibacterium ligniniphilum TaxID=1134413 RepID=UPI00034D83A7|nr:glucose-1-phosphate thymidylyltransferase [Halalkalibacterium ligniniphilum]